MTKYSLKIAEVVEKHKTILPIVKKLLKKDLDKLLEAVVEEAYIEGLKWERNFGENVTHIYPLHEANYD